MPRRFIFGRHGDKTALALSVEGIEQRHAKNDGMSFGEDLAEIVEFDLDAFEGVDFAVARGFVAPLARLL